MTRVVLTDLKKIYKGSSIPAIDGISMSIDSGELVALLGPSGCGKTTTLKVIAGLLSPTSGTLTFDGEDVLSVRAEKRGAVQVFQNHLLFPYMSVGDNVGFGLKMAREEKGAIRQKVQEMLELVKLPDLSKRKPNQLSGGQQQRVALASALIVQPRVLLLDEPLSNLDAHLRDEMRELIVSIQRQLNVTTIMVTHDQEEAVLLADRIALIFDGRLQQYAASADVYQYPISEKAARFFGGVNFIPGEWRGEKVSTNIGDFSFSPENEHTAPEGNVLLTIRPEQLELSKDLRPNCISGTIRSSVYGGTYTRYKVQVKEIELEVIRTADSPGSINKGDQVQVYLPPNRIWLVPPAS